MSSNKLEKLLHLVGDLFESLQHSPKPITGPHSAPDECSPCPATQFI